MGGIVVKTSVQIPMPSGVLFDTTSCETLSVTVIVAGEQFKQKCVCVHSNFLWQWRHLPDSGKTERTHKSCCNGCHSKGGPLLVYWLTCSHCRNIGCWQPTYGSGSGIGDGCRKSLIKRRHIVHQLPFQDLKSWECGGVWRLWMIKFDRMHLALSRAKESPKINPHRSWWWEEEFLLNIGTAKNQTLGR